MGCLSCSGRLRVSSTGRGCSSGCLFQRSYEGGGTLTPEIFRIDGAARDGHEQCQRGPFDLWTGTVLNSRIGSPQTESGGAFLAAAHGDAGLELMTQGRVDRLTRVGAQKPQRTANVLTMHDRFDESGCWSSRRRPGCIAYAAELAQGRFRGGGTFPGDAVRVVSVEIESRGDQLTEEAEAGCLRGIHEMSYDVVNVPAGAERGLCPLLRGERLEFPDQDVAFDVNSRPHRGRRSGRHGAIQPRGWTRQPVPLRLAAASKRVAWSLLRIDRERVNGSRHDVPRCRGACGHEASRLSRSTNGECRAEAELSVVQRGTSPEPARRERTGPPMPGAPARPTLPRAGGER